MKYKNRPRISTGINLTPLIDIVFLLLIFFMLTAHFVSEEAISIELPHSEYASEVEEDKPLVIAVSKDSAFSVGSKIIPKEKLFSTVAMLISSKKVKMLYIKGDKKASLDDIVYVMDAAKAANIEAVAIQSE